MTYPDALAFLGEARHFGMKLGLEPMRDLARVLGEPQRKLRFIHIAGTNGKGSTAAFCESCLRAAGNRAGLYTSPHLVSIRERIQVDRQLISEAEFAEGMDVLREKIEKMPGQAPTFFEIMTGLALWYFARKQVDWVVWETGLGGRLDATNIVDPEICIITNIGLDHQQYLGGTLAEIAMEKAGIIKPGVPVVSGIREGKAEKIVVEKAKELGAPLVRSRVECNYKLGLKGTHQMDNAACAVTAIKHLDSLGRYEKPVVMEEPAYPGGWGFFDSIGKGLQSTQWPGRFEIISEDPLMVLDGAHNAAGTEKLVETWRSFLASCIGGIDGKIDGVTHLVFGSVADKDITEVAQLLRPLVKEVSLVRLANERTADPAKLAEYFSGLPCALYDSVAELWQKLEEKKSASPVLITGSLFLVGEMLARRQGDAGEYALNERLEKEKR